MYMLYNTFSTGRRVIVYNWYKSSFHFISTVEMPLQLKFTDQTQETHTVSQMSHKENFFHFESNLTFFHQLVFTV